MIVIGAWRHNHMAAKGGEIPDTTKWTTPTRIPWDDALLAFLEGYAEGLSELKAIQSLPRRGRWVPNRTRHGEPMRSSRPYVLCRPLRIRLSRRIGRAFL